MVLLRDSVSTCNGLDRLGDGLHYVPRITDCQLEWKSVYGNRQNVGTTFSENFPVKNTKGPVDAHRALQSHSLSALHCLSTQS